MLKQSNKENKAVENIVANEEKVCGIIMPISEGSGYTKTHWTEMRDLINESIKDAGFKPQLVSEANDTGIIHQRIIENIYANPIAVCDISSRNPNVMFELGIRLAFDKPVVIIKDDITDRIFDTDIIEYLQYRRDLRYNSVLNLKKDLTSKITATHDKHKNVGSSFFLKFFSNVKPSKLDEKELNQTEFIIRAIDNLASQIKPTERVKPSSIKVTPSNKITDDKLLEILRLAMVLNNYNDFEQLKSDEKLEPKLKTAFDVVIGPTKLVDREIYNKRLYDLKAAILESEDQDDVAMNLLFG